MQQVNNNLAIIVAFYLSKFDKQGMCILGYKNDKEAFEGIAEKLSVKKNYIKFRRDEFDPIHPWRRGWQRPMDKRIKKAIDALQDLTESELREIVIQLLNDPKYRNSEEVLEITSIFSEWKNKKDKKSNFILRAPTGKQAEEFFISYFSKNKSPFEGTLIDCREFGVGYDFRIETRVENYFVEVKGLTEISGGVLFTSKEWCVAKNKGDKYFLCIVSNLSEFPDIRFIQNPSEKLNPKKNVYSAIQISWSVTEKQLAEIND